jgi:hypothetical protein
MTPLCEALAWLPFALNDASQSRARTAQQRTSLDIAEGLGGDTADAAHVAGDVIA